ncbi:MAG: pyruvate kinase alpha/beta domain-containing protein [Chloroflexota bacterium]
MEIKTTYFEKEGKENTEAVLSIVNNRIKELGIKTVLVASTTGETAAKAVNTLQEVKVIAVGHSTGLRTPNVQEFTPENKKIVEGKGGTVFVGTHLFSGLSGAMSKKFNTHIIGDIIASTLRIFRNGMKVVCEVSCEAADAGLIRTDEDIIVITGSHQGADMAVVIRPVNSQDFFDLKIKEILCKPHL